ncbi:hypothetical protein [Nocardia cyriacigeorgica]|jgi:hypothetical protein|uniref:hypothetical protein n=1 Tax=Nocardia cyriacigeorgica TaxID=135487 RepID=UPI001319F08B|nr:hypothetical protein [Nocardia cyriacigeorgica]MBF6499672.1 hypothetical protein [Nocardia cyriacigeorgica]
MTGFEGTTADLAEQVGQALEHIANVLAQLETDSEFERKNNAYRVQQIREIAGKLKS